VPREAAQLKTLALGRYALNASAAAVFLAGCGGPQPPIGASGPMPQSRAVAAPSGSWMLPEARAEDVLHISSTSEIPPKCKGQVIIAQHAEVTERIPKGGAALCVPSFRGFGGFLGFPGVHPGPQPVKLLVTVPKKGLHPIFNLEWLPGAQFTFRATAPPGGISGSTMTAGKTYTGYGVIYFKGSHKEVAPCYSVATRGKYGGVFNGLGTLMEKQGGSFIAWDLMIYDGKETNRRC
jgi:hypothetical protein